MGQGHPRSRLGIHAIHELPDVVVVTKRASDPDAIPVIPTPEAERYWALNGTLVPISRSDGFTDASNLDTGGIGPDHPSR